jgi:hypothetical protein
MIPTECTARALRRVARKAARTAALGALALAAACASLDQAREDADAAKLRQVRDTYVQCVSAEADKEVGAPAGAEDIVIAAQGRCWSTWDAYRQATYATFAARAHTPDEQQLAHDKADAQLRQAELETRRAVAERIVERTFTKKP